MGLIFGTILVGIGTALGWVMKGKVDKKDKKDPMKPQDDSY